MDDDTGTKPERDERKPITVKAFRTETSEKINRHARMHGLTNAEYIDRAVHTQIRIDGNGGPMIIPPEPGNTPPRAGAPDVAAPGWALNAASALRELAEAALMASQASGRPMPKRTAGRLYSLLDQQLRAAQAAAGIPAGKPPVQTGKPAVRLSHDPKPGAKRN